MPYKIRPGIVHVKICDADLLVATRPVWETCPRIRRIPRLWAACWAIMEQDASNKTDEDVVRVFSSFLKGQDERLRERLESIFSTLFEEGYLIKVSEVLSEALE